MLFIDVTLKFRYKLIISNDFLNKTILTKKGQLNRKMSLYVFLFLSGILYSSNPCVGGVMRAMSLPIESLHTSASNTLGVVKVKVVSFDCIY